ncbi:Ubiquitination Target receptor [Teratosphaeria destructans]|uniref:Ubiquitination Target receptor n=1 Tax=Teratosphaeria destructans TaxID=418781 RepID=A0A9W7SX61_9PEZI|nr:Ubiquitination Target receptor [Teratosphaeria destructans]
MDRLPEEVVLQILTFLDILDLVRLQAVSSRYLALARDDNLWKHECFNHSRVAAVRRRQQLLSAQPSALADLRNAVSALPGRDLTACDVSQLRGSHQPRATTNPAAEERVQRARAMANWEPGYAHEQLDYYQEFIRRHAPIKIGWLDLPNHQARDKEAMREATGLGTLRSCHTNEVSNLVAPLDDGSICIWSANTQSALSRAGRGRLLAQSRPGLLSGRSPEATAESHTIMTETGAVECVSIDSSADKGYFAVQSLLHEVDLNTLQIASTRQYPWPITALSEVQPTAPLTVGTNWTIHLSDPRDPAFGTAQTDFHGAEMIGGSSYSHATLTQPGPLSILHEGTGEHDSSIWVAGRFTSLLNYDRRFFPRLRSTIFSGARIASLAALPFPLIPRSLDLVRNPEASISSLIDARSQLGTTILAAAEYKGKGSLELYGLPRVQPYQNRQTASASKLLSVAAHGATIVFSDGDGNLKPPNLDPATQATQARLASGAALHPDSQAKATSYRRLHRSSP